MPEHGVMGLKIHTDYIYTNMYRMHTPEFNSSEFSISEYKLLVLNLSENNKLLTRNITHDIVSSINTNQCSYTKMTKFISIRT